MGAVAMEQEQRMAALKKANGIRSARARLKKEMKNEGVSIREILTDVPGYAQTMRVYELLTSRPKIGQVKARNICRRIGISPSRYLSQLSARQKAELILVEDSLDGRSSGPGR